MLTRRHGNCGDSFKVQIESTQEFGNTGAWGMIGNGFIIHLG